MFDTEVSLCKSSLAQLASVTSALEYREKRIEELEELVKRMHTLMIDMDCIMDRNHISLDWDHSDRRAAISADVNRLTGGMAGN